jgi:hypothetical protein
MIHGLAGSGALMLLLVPTINRPAVSLGYILLFGIGSTGGMMILSMLVALPAKLISQKIKWPSLVFRGAAGLSSVVVGCWMVYEVWVAGNPLG